LQLDATSEFLWVVRSSGTRADFEKGYTTWRKSSHVLWKAVLTLESAFKKKVDILYESDFAEITYVETVCTVTQGSSREKNY